LAFVYGSGPTSFENSLAWLARVSLLLAIAALVGAVGAIPVPDSLMPLLAPFSAAAAVTAVLASIVARARTEQRTDPIGERHLRFWRGPFGRALFRVAGLRFKPVVPAVRILDRLETPA
jgi:hypothetical protein